MAGESTARIIMEKAKAGYPALYLLSGEDMRSLQEIKKAAKDLSRSLYIWTLTKGIIKDGDKKYINDTENAMGGMMALSKLPEKSIVVLRGFHHFMEDPGIQAVLLDLLHEFKLNQKMIIFLTPVLKMVPELEKEIALIETRLPDESELNEVLDGIVKGSNMKGDDIPEGELKKMLLKSALGLTTSEAENAFSLAVVKPKMNKSTKKWDPSVVMEEKCATLKKTGLLNYYPPGEQGMKQVGGMANLKEWITKRRGAFSEDAKKYGLPAPKGILMVGPPGSGKSLGAKAVSEELTLPLLRCDMGRIFAGLVGASEENTRKVIQTADALAPCVLWLDEIEKGFAGSGSGSLDSGVGARVLGTFLTWMQEKTTPVFVYATANNVAALPPELLRKGRFDDTFSVLLPNATERREIFIIHLTKRNRGALAAKTEDLDQLVKSTDGYSGAEIEAAITEAMFSSFHSKRDLMWADIQLAVDETVPLSQMMAKQIEEMQKWCEGRTRPANGGSTVKMGKAAASGRALS